MSTESSGLQSTRRVLILFPTPACTILLVEQYIPHDLALCGPQNVMCAEKNKRSTQPRPLGMSAKEEVFGDANRNVPDSVWKLLEDCWQTERTLRSSVGDVSGFVRTAAFVCGSLPSVGGIPQQCEDPETDFTNFGRLLSHSSKLQNLRDHGDQLSLGTSPLCEVQPLVIHVTRM